MKTDYVPGAIGFLLPGLGHLYLGRPGRAMALFTGFTLLDAFSSTRWLIPLPILVSAWEAHRLSRLERVPSTSGRNLRFFAVGFVGLFLWLGLLVPLVVPVSPIAKNVSAAERVAAALRSCATSRERLPDALAECPSAPTSDAFGQPFRYRRKDDDYSLESNGPDGRAGTADDVAYHFRYRGGPNASQSDK